MALLTTPKFTGGIINAENAAPYQNIYTASAAQNFILGTKLEFADGRVFRYAKGGGVALVQALMGQSAAFSTTDHYCEVVQAGYAKAAGDGPDVRVLVVTGNVASAHIGAAENDFSGGTLLCNKVSPAVLGDVYKILASKHYSETLLDLRLDQTWRNAMSASGEICVIPSRFMKTVVYAAFAATGPAIGVPLCPVPIGYYYWAQTKGPAPLITDTSDVVAVGQPVGCAVTLAVPGACGPLVFDPTLTAAAQLPRSWGTVIWIAAAAGDEPAIVDLCLE